MATQVTQCPKCRTSFRVTEAQLGIANGAVRCGSCLHIFNAPDHWIGTQQPKSTAPAAAPKPAEAKPEAKPAPPPPPEPEPENELIEDGDDDTSGSSLFKSLDEEPEPAFNDTIEQNVIDNIFDDDIELERHKELFEEPPARDNDGDSSSTQRHAAIGDSIDPVDEGIELEEDDLLFDDDTLAIGDDDSDEDKAFGDTGKHSIIESIDDEFALNEEIQGKGKNRGQREHTDDFSDSFLEIDSWEKEDKRVFKDLDELGEDSIGSEDDWARKLMEDDDGEAGNTRQTAPAPTPPAAAPKPKPRPEPDLDIDLELDDEPQPAAARPDELIDDDSDIDDDVLIDDNYASEEPEDQFEDIFADLDDGGQPMDNELRDILNERDDTSGQEEPEQDEFLLGDDEPLLAGDRIGNEKRALLANIEPEPVVFSTTLDRGRWIRIGWAAGTVLAILVFGFQYVAFNFDRLARDDSYRGMLGSACAIVGCTMPDRDDVALIRSTNLMVRSHPRAANALVVDAIITNRATFQQRFPAMELQFTDLSGKLVAARQFEPQEYLDGELAGMQMMPVNQPIHVSLEIIDPGQRAVNYQMRLQANKNR